MSTLAPAASVPFQAAFAAVTAEPDCDQVALHPCVTCWPEGKENVRRQLLRAEPPVLVTRTEPVKPVFQLFAVYLTAQAPALVGGGVVGGAVVGGGVVGGGVVGGGVVGGGVVGCGVVGGGVDGFVVEITG